MCRVAGRDANAGPMPFGRARRGDTNLKRNQVLRWPLAALFSSKTDGPPPVPEGRANGPVTRRRLDHIEYQESSSTSSPGSSFWTLYALQSRSAPYSAIQAGTTRRRTMYADYLVSALVTLLVAVDPVGLAPIFLSLTRGMNAGERRRVAVRASLIAFGILAFFGLGGEILLPARRRHPGLPHLGRPAAVLDRLRDGVRAPQRAQAEHGRHRHHRGSYPQRGRLP